MSDERNRPGVGPAPDSSKEIGVSGIKISSLAGKSASKEITSAQANLPLGIERDGEFGQALLAVENR